MPGSLVQCARDTPSEVANWSARVHVLFRLESSGAAGSHGIWPRRAALIVASLFGATVLPF